MKVETLKAIEEVEQLKNNPNKKTYDSFEEITEELNENIEDEYDIAVADEAYKEYLESGKKSRPFTELVKELGFDKKYNWINDEVKIDFPVPKSIQYQIDRLESLDQEENDHYFDVCDYLDDDAKNCYVEGVLTKEQWKKIIQRYNPYV